MFTSSTLANSSTTLREKSRKNQSVSDLYHFFCEKHQALIRQKSSQKNIKIFQMKTTPQMQ
jgi:hypothetical protein